MGFILIGVGVFVVYAVLEKLGFISGGDGGPWTGSGDGGPFDILGM